MRITDNVDFADDAVILIEKIETPTEALEALSWNLYLSVRSGHGWEFVPPRQLAALTFYSLLPRLILGDRPGLPRAH